MPKNLPALTHRFLLSAVLFFCMVCLAATTAFAQTTLTGSMMDGETKKSLPFVNIGIRHKNIGTLSGSRGSFTLAIPDPNKNDTLTFSCVGYEDLTLVINDIIRSGQQSFLLKPKPRILEGVTVYASKRVEKKMGFTNTHALMHFVDASTNQGDIFEIAQLIEGDAAPARITAVNLLITEPREDSGIFRINFYGYDGTRPTGRIVEKSILQTKRIEPGFLNFDLKKYMIYLKGSFVIGIEFLPSVTAVTKPIHYEVKLGGSTRSFVRSHSQADWRVPPHHYKLYVTALVSPGAKKGVSDDEQEKETKPTARIFSRDVGDSFSIFTRLPKDYEKNKHKKNYPVVYLLDANAYFDIVSNTIADIAKDKNTVEPILVGIGYRDFIENDSLRNRDYTYPKALASDSFTVSGGADKFLDFIQSELIPMIDKQYKTDTTERTLMGHSLGGYFTLFALKKELEQNSHAFHHFVAASPSLHYYNYYLPGQFANLNVPAQAQPLRDLLVTMGGEENSEDGEIMTAVSDSFNSFTRKFADKWAGTITIKGEIYPGLYHMETATRTFADQLLVLMKKP